VGKFLEFRFIPNPGKKTLIYGVFSMQDHTPLGKIYWRCGWRRYVMSFDAQTDWDSDCMRECDVFVNKLMQDRMKPNGKDL